MVELVAEVDEVVEVELVVLVELVVELVELVSDVVSLSQNSVARLNRTLPITLKFVCIKNKEANITEAKLLDHEI